MVVATKPKPKRQTNSNSPETPKRQTNMAKKKSSKQTKAAKDVFSDNPTLKNTVARIECNARIGRRDGKCSGSY